MDKVFFWIAVLILASAAASVFSDHQGLALKFLIIFSWVLLVNLAFYLLNITDEK